MPPLRHGLTAAAVMNEGAQRRATEFLKELYAAGGIDAGRFNTGVAGLLAATTDTELAEVVRSFDDRVIDLHVYTGWGSITIIVPRASGPDHGPQGRR